MVDYPFEKILMEDDYEVKTFMTHEYIQRCYVLYALVPIFYISCVFYLLVIFAWGAFVFAIRKQ